MTCWRLRLPCCTDGVRSRAAARLPHGGGSDLYRAWSYPIRRADTAQVRIALPVEVRYDEFTDDILANRLVKAAAYRLGHMGLRSPKALNDLGWIAGTLDNVSPVEFPAGDVPEVRFDRLNEHYRGVVALSRLILRHSEFQANRGAVRASGFLVDMNVLFQDFVTVALREALGVSENAFRSDKNIPKVTLDQADSIKLEPDLSWWESGKCTFVGDAKYKRVYDGRAPNADIYQMLAYVTALDLPGGMLGLRQGRGRAGGSYCAAHRQAAGDSRPRPLRRSRRDTRGRGQTRRQGKGATR